MGQKIPNWLTDVWRIYRGKGFVWDLIEKDALLASYGRFKMPFCPLSLPNRTPIGARTYANWGTIGTQLAPNWPRYKTNWVNWRGAIVFIKITYRINSIYDRIVELFTINVRTSRFLQYSLYWFKLEVVERTRSRSKLARRLNTHENSNDVSRVRDNRNQ